VGFQEVLSSMDIANANEGPKQTPDIVTVTDNVFYVSRNVDLWNKINI
jgi:hypothetical protein